MITITLEFENDKTAEASIDLSYNRFKIELRTDNNQEWLRQLVDFHISYLPVFSSFLTQEERRTPAVIEDSLARGRVNSVIRNLLYDLKHKDKIEPLEKILQSCITTFNNLKVTFDEVTDRFINVSYTEEGKKKDFDLFMAGSGFQQFVYLFGFILLKDPNVILLDEPDVHLHGTLQNSLIIELRNLVKLNKQVIFATHSRELITRIEPDSIIVLNDNKATRLAVQYDIYDTLESLGSFDNIQIAQLQIFRRLLILEDKSDWNLIQIFGRKIIGGNNWLKIEKRLAICYANGNPYMQNIPHLKIQINSMFSLMGIPLKLLVVCDLDYYPEREKLLKDINKYDDIEYIIWIRNEIENYLLINNAILRTAGFNPDDRTFFDNELEKEIKRLIDSSKDKVEDKLMRSFESFGKNQRKSWDSVTIKNMAIEYLSSKWEKYKISLTDAKDIVLPGIKRWLQNNGYKQFSDISLAEEIKVEEIDPEIKEFIHKLAEFVSIRIE